MNNEYSVEFNPNLTMIESLELLVFFDFRNSFSLKIIIRLYIETNFVKNPMNGSLFLLIKSDGVYLNWDDWVSRTLVWQNLLTAISCQFFCQISMFPIQNEKASFLYLQKIPFYMWKTHTFHHIDFILMIAIQKLGKAVEWKSKLPITATRFWFTVIEKLSK